MRIVKISIVPETSPIQCYLSSAGKLGEECLNTRVMPECDKLIEIQETHPFEFAIRMLNPVFVGLGLLVSALKMLMLSIPWYYSAIFTMRLNVFSQNRHSVVIIQKKVIDPQESVIRKPLIDKT